MKYAVIKSGGKQYKVCEGDIIEVERLEVSPNQKFSFDEILLYVSDQAVKIGKPRVEGILVGGKLLQHTKGDKIKVSKFKSKVRYRRTMGHRQSLSKVLIESINLGEGKKVKERKKPQDR